MSAECRIERMNKPNKWVTLRAMRVLKRLGVDVAAF
jgi:hypothetical protein